MPCANDKHIPQKNEENEKLYVKYHLSFITNATIIMSISESKIPLLYVIHSQVNLVEFHNSPSWSVFKKRSNRGWQVLYFL